MFNLLFELSNEDRVSLLLRLQSKPQRLSHIARELKFTRQETSRNLARLSHAQLIRRDVDGTFHLTPYGEQVLNLLPSFAFLSKHTDYFTTHGLSFLPSAFLYRIGDLVNCSYADNALLTFDDCVQLINQAEEYLWLITPQHSVSMLPRLQHALERQVQIRVIIPPDLVPPPDFHQHAFVQAFLDVYHPAIQSGVYEERQLHPSNVCLLVADHVQGHIVFATLDGNFDYSGFTVNDPPAHQFCKDLFLFYWNQAQPRSSSPLKLQLAQ